MMRNIKLIVEYDGTGYHGWQYQPDVPTIQGTLEEKLFTLIKEKIRVNGAGRTDAGTHAKGQVAHFITASTTPLSAFTFGLNSLLPPDIVVLSAEEVQLDFDARRCAKSKVYRYSILNRFFPSALQRNYSWWIPGTLDLTSMIESAGILLGTHDFSSFQAQSDLDGSPPDSQRTVVSASLRRDGDMVSFDIEADGFLRHMVRNIVGTLVFVGKGKITPLSFRDILESRDRTRAGPTAPAQGLCLKLVKY